MSAPLATPERPPAPQPQKKQGKKPGYHRDPTRETVETVVFVAVLVLLLKLFVTEAFVIPTGSMATTLYGIHKMIDCPQCGHEFPVNSHDEVEGEGATGRRRPLFGFVCPNCRYMGRVQDLKPQPRNETGDRVLVLKPIYHVRQPQRGDVVVFKFPKEPQVKQTAQNYIKRAEGFGGETVAIHHGDLYVTRSLAYSADDLQFPRPSSPLDVWHSEYTYFNNQTAAKLFEDSMAKGFPPGPNGPFSGGFEIVRKGEKQLLADCRIVWDNDKQPAYLADVVPPRWYALPEGKDAWRGDDHRQPKVFAHSGPNLHEIRYRHLSMQWKTDPPNPVDPTPATDLSKLGQQAPAPIDNFLGYNAGIDLDNDHAVARNSNRLDEKWVGDLILECEADLGSGAEVVLGLSKGVNRFSARFADGQVTLSMTGRGSETFKNPSRPCKVKTGKHRLRFANVDCKLWVWVNGTVVDFGNESNYQPVEPQPGDGASPDGWVQANDVDDPASIGAKGDVMIAHITLHRDIYYTRTSSETVPADILYVQPGCYLCLGDNSAQSSDSRMWGLVPERLMLGKAVFVFWPYYRVGFIR